VYRAYIHNVTICMRTSVTPLQSFTGAIPDVSNLRTFGCKVFYRVSDEVRKKLEPKGEPGIYLGPAYDGPGVRILVCKDDNQWKKYLVKIVRDVFSIESLTRNCGVQQKSEDMLGSKAPDW
jgi:hypothetical protein